MFIITDTIQVRSITDEIIPFQSGGVFSWHAKLTGAQHKSSIYSGGSNTEQVRYSDGP